ncbi:MAG: glycosyltransferase, partial [Chloroflexi bacterium]|nr:glycosyltransferase [Chloroflexota bacterium]
MKLIIILYHFRPGGIRRVIELAAPHLLRRLAGSAPSVTLASGEAPDTRWRAEFAEHLAGVPVECCVIPGCAYLSEQHRSPSAIAGELRSAFSRLLAGGHAGNCLVWAHNLGLGRNPLLARELARACAVRGIPLLAHHHDWWFDNRWPRWNEMKRAGWPTLKAAADNVFPAGTNVFHLGINQADAQILRRHFGARAAWVPNLMEPAPPPAPARVRAARAWLREQLGADGPVWLMPCRLLRRKNVAEALLLTRWLRPGAWLVTTGGVSSADEMAYADKLAAAARRHDWPLQLGMLQRNEASQPTVAELLAASEAVLLTSLQEGFGLPYLEAAAARRPLIARLLANVAPDLAQFGFRFPQSYQEIL